MTNKRLELINDLCEVDRLSDWIRDLSRECNLPGDKVFKLNLALEEAVVNVINYAYPGQSKKPITLNAEVGTDTIVFELVDRGVPFNPTNVATPDVTLTIEERPIGGLGIMLVREYMQSVSYDYVDGCNRLIMTFSLK